jgi:transaldolase
MITFVALMLSNTLISVLRSLFLPYFFKSQLSHIYSVQNFRTEILAASIRSALHIVKAAEAGADICTCPLDSILGLLKHPLTDIGLAKFLEDAKKM